jgi:hypothetical protein
VVLHGCWQTRANTGPKLTDSIKNGRKKIENSSHSISAFVHSISAFLHSIGAFLQYGSLLLCGRRGCRAGCLRAVRLGAGSAITTGQEFAQRS